MLVGASALDSRASARYQASKPIRARPDRRAESGLVSQRRSGRHALWAALEQSLRKNRDLKLRRGLRGQATPSLSGHAHKRLGWRISKSPEEAGLRISQLQTRFKEVVDELAVMLEDLYDWQQFAAAEEWGATRTIDAHLKNCSQFNS